MRAIVLLLVLWFATFSSAQEVWFTQGVVVPAPKVLVQEVINFNATQASYNQLNNEEKEVYYYTNLARQNPMYFWDSVVNPILIKFPHLKGWYSKSLKEDLEKAGKLPLLHLQPKLIKTAKAHASDMASAKGEYFSHSSTNGKTFNKRMADAGINAYTAENIAMGQQAVVLSVVLLFLDIDIPDFGHRQTLLSKQYIQIGVGVSYKTKDQFYIVQDFCGEIY